MITLISADIGGTKTIIELSQFYENRIHSIKKQTLESATYSCFSNMLAGFIEPEDKIDAACFAIAGPIQREITFQTAKVTNLPWNMSSKILEETFNIPKIQFINDFQAMGYAISHLPDKDIEVLQAGKPEVGGVRAVIGAGTGLGEAILVFNGHTYEVLPTEGGHQDFAANDEQEFSLFQSLQQKYGHVSYERVLSGAGLVALFHFLSQQKSVKNNLVQDILENPDPAAAISSAANAKSNIIATEALSLFMKIYGAKAGNFALNCLPVGGIYLTGGIAGKNSAFLKNSEFLSSFNAKGRMQSLLEQIPVNLVTNQEAGLLGATQYALSMVNKNE